MDRRGFALVLISGVFLPCISLAAASPPAVATPAGGVVIAHDGIACIVAERFTRLESRFDPPERLSRARVYFRAGGTTPWYYVEMQASGTGFIGVLPKARKTTRTVDYYLLAVDRAVGESRTAEFHPAVVGSSGECDKKLVALALPEAKVALGAPRGAPPLPEGFDPAGLASMGNGSLPTAAHHKGVPLPLILVGGAAVARGVALAAGGGGSGGGGVGGGGESSAITASIASVSPAGTALVGASTITFTAGPGGSGTPSYAWDFGDGTTGSGQTVTHVFQRDGTFSVVLTVSSSGRVGTATTSLSARSLTGRWVETQAGGGDTHDLVQAGTSVGGTFTTTGGKVVSLNGTVSNPRDVVYNRTDCDRQWDLVVNEAITQMNGTEIHLVNGDCNQSDPSRNSNVVLTRQ